MTDDRKYALSILTAVAYPEILAEKLGYIPKFTLKNRILKKAIREVKKTGDTSMVVMTKRTRDGKGNVIYLAVYEHPTWAKRNAFTPGVILCMGLKEIPFKNVIEGNEALKTADAIYHYHRSFKQYQLPTGVKTREFGAFQTHS